MFTVAAPSHRLRTPRLQCGSGRRGARLNWQAAYDADPLVGGGETCDGGATVARLARLEETDRCQRRAGHARLAPSALRPGRPMLASVVTAPGSYRIRPPFATVP